jgi:hypothetical protein
VSVIRAIGDIRGLIPVALSQPSDKKEMAWASAASTIALAFMPLRHPRASLMATEFTIENNVTFSLPNEDVVRTGVCAGMTTLWCKKMLQGLRKQKAKPDLNLSKDLEIRYLQAVENEKQKVAEGKLTQQIIDYFGTAGLQIKDVGTVALETTKISGVELGKNIPAYVQSLPGTAHWLGIPKAKGVEGSVGHVVGAFYAPGEGYFYLEPEKGAYRFDDFKTFEMKVTFYYTDRLNVQWWPLFELVLADGGEDKAGKGKCCYLTTATCLSLGLPDDCEALTTLRWFRDHVLLQTPAGAADVETYYHLAPRVVAAIDRRPDAAAVYRALYERAIEPAVLAIKAGDFTTAHGIFKRLVIRPLHLG